MKDGRSWALIGVGVTPEDLVEHLLSGFLIP